MEWARGCRCNAGAVHWHSDTAGHVTKLDPRRMETRDLSAATPRFERVEEYPFRNPTRMFWNPFALDEVWVTSFGGGVQVMAR